MEKKYEFRKRLLEVHKKNIRNSEIIASKDDLEIFDETIITIPKSSDIVIKTAVEDFKDYLFTSMNLTSRIGDNGLIVISVDNSAEETSFKITVDDKIRITASNERGAAQALYYLEDLMNERKAPIIKKGEINKKLSFSPRIIHSGYKKSEMPDEYLAHIAHHGINAIMIRVNAVDAKESAGFVQLLKRAAKYGIDIYMFSYIDNKYHPDDPGALQYYESTYGKFVELYPETKGVILVGECCGFPSKDPRSSGTHRGGSVDNIPNEKPDTGFCPCNDYYQLINMIKDVTRSKKSDFDIVFWSYNWWYFPEKDRLELIDSLPTDISFLVTFELSHTYKMDGITKLCSDYTISRPGPSDVFKSEAKRAKERGIRVYSQTCASGMTWDFGTIPYMPMPQKWIKRYEAIVQAQKDFGLCGMIENWTPGFYPSIVSELAKKCFMDIDSDFDENLKTILKNHFENDAETVYKALDLWSEATDYIHASYEEQYGPLRVGTAYPLCFLSTMKSPYASPWYNTMHGVGSSGFQTNYSVRDEVETAHWIKMSELMMEGVNLLKTINNPSQELDRLINLGQYIYHCVITVINVHKWHVYRDEFKLLKDNASIEKTLNAMEQIAEDEKKNALESIECLRKDSRLGFEPIDDYVGGEQAVLWKIKQVDYVVRAEIGKCRKELKF